MKMSSSGQQQQETPSDVVCAVDRRLICEALLGNESRCREVGDIATSPLAQAWSGLRFIDHVLMTDTGEVSRWIYTAKAGVITAKRKPQDHDHTKIVDRFERFALANPQNKESYVALIGHNGKGYSQESCTALNKAGLIEILARKPASRELCGATLRCYLRPRDGSNSFLRATYRWDRDTLSLVRHSPLFCEQDSANIKDGASRVTRVCPNAPHTKEITRQVDVVTKSMVAFLEARMLSDGGGRIAACRLDFIVDDNDELWLASIPRVAVKGKDSVCVAHAAASGDTTVHPSRGNNTRVADHGPEENLFSTSCVPTLAQAQVAPAEGSSQALCSSQKCKQECVSASNEVQNIEDRTESAPAGSLGDSNLPRVTKMLGARSAPGDHNDRTSTKQGPAVIEQQGASYVANTHISTLRGLCAWLQVSPTRRIVGFVALHV